MPFFFFILFSSTIGIYIYIYYIFEHFQVRNRRDVGLA